VPLTTIGPPSRFVNRFLMGNELLVNMLGLFVILGAGKVDDDEEVKKLLSWWLLFMSPLGSSVKMGISAAAACPSNSSIEVGGVTNGSVAEVV